MGKKATIYDVSRKAGVSAATVSRVLNNPGKVNPETRRAVETAIRDLDYKPLLEMRLRSVKDVPRICVCSPHFTSQSYVQRLRGIHEHLGALDFETELQIRVVNSKSQLDRFIETISMRDLDGIIFLSLMVSDEQVRKIRKAGVECVLVEKESQLCSCILNDDYEGGRMAARYLIERGYEDFGVLCEPFHWDYTVYTMEDRVKGFRDELGLNGYSLPDQFYFTNRMESEAVRRQMGEVFREGAYPRAFFATADIMAFGLLQAVRDADLKVPDNAAVIGFDDLDFSDAFGLTTISQHLEESGRIAAGILMGKLRNPNSADQQVRLTLSLVERESA